MAPPASKKQKRASHGSQNPPKYPSTLDIPSACTDQIETKEVRSHPDFYFHS